MDEEIKTGEMTGEIDESITVEEDFTLLEGKAVSITDDSDNKTNEEEVYEEALDIKESLDDIRQQIKDKLLDILEKGRITDVDGCEIELLNDQYTEKYNELKDVANTVIPGGTGVSTSTTNTPTTNTSTTEIVKTNIDYDEILKAINERADWLYIDEDGQVMLNGEVVPKLKVVELEAEKIKADVGEFKTLTAENFQAVNAKIDNLEVTDLTAVNADITNLKALVAEIQTLIGGNLTMDNIQSLVLTSDKVTIADALIKNAMIDSISANKIDSGTINTNNVNIQSADGSMVINGTTQQFKDKNGVVRIQIGKDMQGNFTFALFSQDGQGILIDETGIKSGAVPNGLIVNDMVSDNANISGGKLDISSVISSINDNVNTLKSSKIKFDDTNQTLDIAFNQLKTKVETIENITIDGDLSSVMEQVTTNTTDISVMQGQISSLISNTTITKANGETVQLKDEFNSVKDTVNSHTQTINSLETNYRATLKTTTTEYYVSTSNTSQTGGSWSETSPTWTAGKYIWQRMKYTYTDNSVKYSTAVCIQGAKGEQGLQGDKGDQGEQGLQGERGEQGIQGATGEKGQSLTKSTPQWYASTSKTSQTGGSWVESMPTIDSSHYLWLRYKLDWANPTATTYTTPTLEQIAENIKEVSAKQVKFQQDLDGFKTTVSETYATQTTTNSMLSQIQQNADSISTKVDVNGVISSINQSSETIAINANKINLNGYVSNDNANWSIDNEGNMKAENLKIEGEAGANTLSVNYIDNPCYPATLAGSVDLYINADTGNDDYTIDDILQSYDEAEEKNNDTLKKKFKTIQGAIDAIPKFLNNKTVYITMETNSTEDVYIRGVVGGAIRIYMNGKTLFGTLKSYACSATITTYGGTKDNTEGATGIIHPSVGMSFGSRAVSVGFEASQYCAIYKVKVFAPDTKPSDVSSGDKVCVASQSGTGSVYCKNIEIVNATVGFRSNNHGSMHVNSSSGVASKYGFQSATGGIISIANNNQCGGKTSATNKGSGGQIWYDDGKPTFATGNQTTDGGSAPVVSNTKTMTIKSSYGDTYRSSVYDNWKKDGTVRQGDYGYGDCTGCWFFGTAFAELKGKTITKVQITIKRQTGGSSVPVEHKLWMHGHTVRPSGAPKLTSGWSQTFRLATGNSTTVLITNSAVLNAISAGTCKGFALRHTYDSAHYAVCSGSVTVKITYTE